VSEQLPPRLAAVIDRIAGPEPSTAPLPPDVTGALADLAAWWRTLSGGAVLAVTELDLAAPGSVPDAITAGIEAAERAVDGGATLIVPRVRRRDDEAARTLIALLTRKEASAVVAQPQGMADRAWMGACAAVRDRAAQAAEHRGDPVSLLAAVDAPGIAQAVGALLGAAARRTPCLVDGTDELAAALVADRLCIRAKAWWRAGSDSPDPGRAAAADRMDLAAGLPLGLTDDAGRGAQATLALLGLLVPPAP
jgi:nicotinate-nucleotide--dimethylbenzimidazole phosphoribosyltransferase